MILFIHYIYIDLLFSNILLVNGKLKNIGDELKNPELAATLEKIKNNPHDFYNGSLAKDVVQEVAAKNGIITEADLKNYKISIKKTISFDFDNMKMHTMPAPGSGAVLAMVINIMHGKFLTVLIAFSIFLIHPLPTKFDINRKIYL